MFIFFEYRFAFVVPKICFYNASGAARPTGAWRLITPDEKRFKSKDGHSLLPPSLMPIMIFEAAAHSSLRERKSLHGCSWVGAAGLHRASAILLPCLSSQFLAGFLQTFLVYLGSRGQSRFLTSLLMPVAVLPTKSAVVLTLLTPKALSVPKVISTISRR